MSNTNFQVPDLKLEVFNILEESILPKIIHLCEHFFSRYRKERFYQFEFLDSNNLLPEDLTLITTHLANFWSRCVSNSKKLSSLNRIIIRITPDDFLHLTQKDQIFEKVITTTTPTYSMIETGFIETLFAQTSGVHQFVNKNKGLNFVFMM